MKKLADALSSRKGDKVLNYIIYTLFFIIVGILGYSCYTLNIQANQVPDTIWKEYNTVTYVEVPVTKTVTKTIYKTKEVSKDRPVEYSRDTDGTILVDIK